VKRVTDEGITIAATFTINGQKRERMETVAWGALNSKQLDELARLGGLEATPSDLAIAASYAALAANQIVAAYDAAISAGDHPLVAHLTRRIAEAKAQATYDAAMTDARRLVGMRRWKDALEPLEWALEAKPDDADATALLADVRKHVEPEPTLSLDLGGGVTMELVYVKPGRFTMGSPASEVGRDNDETQHEVTITRGFYLGKCEVTQAQYQAVTGANPSKWKEANRPVECVSWHDATEFCSRLSRSAAKQVRLPTEAEWEHACRAGSTTRYCFGDSDGSFGEYAWFGENSDNQTHAVGGKRPNAWGLFDMHGNAWEWCSDWYGNYGGAATDPTGPASGYVRLVRGGAYCYSPQNCRSADRFSLPPANPLHQWGFRVAVSSPLK
jgi:formylglycine-generating enzyme required for sulfatase activity